MKLLKNPLIPALIAIMLSVAIGLSAIIRVSGPILEQAAAARAKAEAAKPKKEPGWDFWTLEIENLAEELKEQKAVLAKRSELLDQREARLASEAKELAAMRSEIEGLRKEIGDKIVTITEDETKNLKSLAKTYAELTPRAVVAIIREMDDKTAVKILSFMKADVVSPIFEEMSKTAGTDGPMSRRAAVLSEQIRLLQDRKTTS